MTTFMIFALIQQLIECHVLVSGKQINSKNQVLLLLLEVPSSLNSDVWNNSEKYYDKVWQQMKEISE